MRIAALIVAAGRGSRVGGDVPKQYVRIGGVTVLQRVIDTFAGSPSISVVQVVIHSDDAALYASSLTHTPFKLREPTLPKRLPGS